MPERWRQPFASSAALQARMSAQRSQDTAPELAVRRALHSMGLRYRVHVQPLASLRRKADVVFTRARIAVFVDGCFWHGCLEHGRRRHDVNSWYWPEKIARNQRRDADTDTRLHEAGWTVVRVWEHEPSATAAQRVADAVRGAARDRRS
ncbi:MAG: very short patch repair endonuclease [Acidimicrobiales bacterium]